MVKHQATLFSKMSLTLYLWLDEEGVGQTHQLFEAFKMLLSMKPFSIIQSSDKNLVLEEKKVYMFNVNKDGNISNVTSPLKGEDQ